MTETDTFRELIRRVRDGDQDAATALVREYEPEIRRMIRVRLTNPKLGRVVDSMDICQSVMANFFVRAANGQFDLEKPEQLVRLLVTMAKNKLIDQARRRNAQKRPDGMRAEGSVSSLMNQVASEEPSPSQIVERAELLAAVRRHLSPEERALVDDRAAGMDWAEIAASRGSTAEAVRKQHSRALDRVVEAMGLNRNDIG